MDLTRLYNLTTPELREEAERLGVNDTYAMSRGQLIHAIRNRVSGEQPEGFFGKVLGFARWAIQAAQEEPRKGSERRWAEAEAPEAEARPEPEPKRFERPSEPPMPAIGAEAAAGTGTAVGAAASSDTGAVTGTDALMGTVTGTGADMGTVTDTDVETDSAAGVASGPPSRPPVGVFSKSASIFDEPFPTRTMARILAEQGHFKRALAIYATLLRQGSADAELSAEAEDVRARSRARRPQVR